MRAPGPVRFGVVGVLVFGVGVACTVVTIAMGCTGGREIGIVGQGTEASTEAAPPTNTSSSCGALESIECGGPGLPFHNPSMCGPTMDGGGAGVSPTSLVMAACVSEEDCGGDLFACGASMHCPGADRCCADLGPPRIVARCKPSCSTSEVELCDEDTECDQGRSECKLHQCPSTTRKALLACKKPASCN